MKYYHAVRIIRNNINHAAGDMQTSGKKMKQYLEEKGLEEGDNFVFELNKQSIYDVLEAGIQYSRQISEEF